MDLKLLKTILEGRLSPDDFEEACFELDIDANEFVGGVSTRTRKLLLFLHQRDRVNELILWIEEYRPDINLKMALDWKKNSQSADLLVLNLIGSWNENFSADIEVINSFLKSDYSDWIHQIREIYHNQNNKIIFKNGKWEILNRKELFEIFSSKIFDSHLDIFKSKFIEVLGEPDPKFGLPKDQRFAANLNGKVSRYSPELKKGLAETLSLINHHSASLINCSTRKSENVSILAVRAIFKDSDWQIWASLGNLLPIIAEASPHEFLRILEKEFGSLNSSIGELFKQEESGIFGGAYHSGILRALETLVWVERYFIRVCLLLADLSNHDPGGNTSDRPLNLLTTIFLPWLPQTTAPFKKRKVVIETMRREHPKVTWNLLKSLLPDQNRSSTNIRKPMWVDIPDADLEEEVSLAYFWEQTEFYINTAISMAKEDFDKLSELPQFLGIMPPESFDQTLLLMSSIATVENLAESRNMLWNKLVDQISHHRQFSHAKWAMDEIRIEKIENVANLLAPEKPSQIYQRLFNNRDHEHFEKRDNYEERRKGLEVTRIDAIRKIIVDGGLDQILLFAKQVEAPRKVGYALSRIACTESDEKLLPNFLDKEDWHIKEFVSGYVWGSQNIKGLNWVDNLDRSHWSTEQACQFLIWLPFENETWNRAPLWLGELEGTYWFKVAVHPFHAQSNLEYAVDKLLESKRPIGAIDCLLHMKQDHDILDTPRIVKALLDVVQLEEPPNQWETYQSVQLIKSLQENSDGIEEELFKIEWAYLPLLTHDNEASPVTLESKLASDPNFFCEVIRLLYRSKFVGKSEVKKSPQQEAFAVNVWELLTGWTVAPGTDAEGVFSKEIFANWVDEVIKSSLETGHFEVALGQVGQVLIHSPADSGGLWIDTSIAQVINDRKYEDIRRGFSTGIINSRGVVWVDPTGKPERDLAGQFRGKAEQVENAGFYRFAITLREIADSYDREADNIIARNNDY